MLCYAVLAYLLHVEFARQVEISMQRIAYSCILVIAFCDNIKKYGPTLQVLLECFLELPKV